MTHKRYENYVDTQEAWLGSYPSHWGSKPLWTLFRRVKRQGFESEELLSVYRDHGVIPKSSREDNFNKPSDDLGAYQLVEPGDLAVNKMKAWQGSVAISEHRGIVSPAYHVYTPLHSENHRFLHYLMRCDRYITGYLSISNGIRINQWDLQPEYHSRMPVLLPPLDEQIVIASFLDHETAKIDALIAEQKHLIELLQEKRQAVISHAVTKGLNPNAPMKDSGVEWLGQIPITWESPSLGVLISKAELGENFDSSESNEGLPVIKMGNLGRGFVKLDKVERLTDGAEVGDTTLLRDGDFLFNTRNSLDLVGKVALWRSELPMATYNSNILRINFNAHKVASSDYMSHLFNSSFGVSQLRALAKGTTNVAAIYYKDLTSFRVLLPSLEEQHAISKYLDNACAKIKELIAKAGLAVDLLQERRSALISAAVTGQIDVRGLTEEVAA